MRIKPSRHDKKLAHETTRQKEGPFCSSRTNRQRLMDMAHACLWPMALMTFAFLLYIPGYHAEFQFDDNAYILESQEILDVEHCLTELARHPFRPDRMLVTLSFALNYHFHGLSPLGFRLVNILVHGLNGMLGFFLLLHLLRMQADRSEGTNPDNSFFVALACAFLFLAHPVAVNSVTYITQRHGLMATFFYLAGLLSYLHMRNACGVRQAVWAASLGFCFLCAIHSKPMALTLPLVIVTCELLYISRDHHHLRRTLTWSGIAVILSGIALAAYAWQSDLFSEKASLAGFRADALWSPLAHLFTESTVFVHYWMILLFPFPGWISGDHYYPVIHAIQAKVIFSWLFHGIMLYAALWFYLKRQQLVAFGVCWFYLTLVPPYLILPIQDVMVDYKTYLPSVGVLFLAGAGGMYCLQRYRSKITFACFAALLLLFCLATTTRNHVFRTQESFWGDVIDKYPDEARPYNNRGLFFYRKKDYQKAIVDFQKAITLAPQYGIAHANIGDAYRDTGDIVRAKEHYLQYILLRPEDGDGYVRLANIHAKQGDWKAAVDLYEKAAKIDPENLGVLYNLGLGLGHLGNYDRALIALKKVVFAQPHHYKALATMGSVYYQKGERSIARDFYHKSLAIEPKFPEALFNLAAYYAGAGQLEEAKKIAARLVQVDPQRGKQLLEKLTRNR